MAPMTRRSGLTVIVFIGILAMTGCDQVIAPSARPEPPPDSPAAASDAAWPRCEGPTYTVAYAPSWFVHPPNADVALCSLFAAQPFETALEFDGGWSGAQIVFGSGSGCIGSFEVAIRSDEKVVDGHPAWRHELQTGEGPNRPEPFALQYFVNLGPPLPCETSEWLYARTESDDPGDFGENRAILDEMMSTIQFLDAD